MKDSGKNQRSRILVLLLDARGAWVPLPEILDLRPRIAQYSPRIKKLRALGFQIESRKEWVNGRLHTFFRLNGGVANPTSAEPARLEQAHEWIARGRAGEPTLFDVERSHRDDN